MKEHKLVFRLKKAVRYIGKFSETKTLHKVIIADDIINDEGLVIDVVIHELEHKTYQDMYNSGFLDKSEHIFCDTAFDYEELTEFSGSAIEARHTWRDDTMDADGLVALERHIKDKEQEWGDEGSKLDPDYLFQAMKNKLDKIAIKYDAVNGFYNNPVEVRKTQKEKLLDDILDLAHEVLILHEVVSNTEVN